MQHTHQTYQARRRRRRDAPAATQQQWLDGDWFRCDARYDDTWVVLAAADYPTAPHAPNTAADNTGSTGNTGSTEEAQMTTQSHPTHQKPTDQPQPPAPTYTRRVEWVVLPTRRLGMDVWEVLRLTWLYAGPGSRPVVLERASHGIRWGQVAATRLRDKLRDAESTRG